MADSSSSGSDNTHSVRLRDDGPPVYRRLGGVSATRSEPIIDGLSEAEHDYLVGSGLFNSESRADGSVASSDSSSDSGGGGNSESDVDASDEDADENVGADDLLTTANPQESIDPGEVTIDELESHLDGHDYSDAELRSLADAEENDKSREGALEVIENARNADSADADSEND
jgi:hypothetical protein